MHWSKTILTSLLLAVFCLPLLSPIYLQLQQQYTRWQMMEALEKKELVEVCISPSAIQWLHDGKECIINGELFDVKEMHALKNQIILIGLYDQKEKAIKADLEDYTKQHQQPEKTQQVLKLFQFIVTDFGSTHLSAPIELAIQHNRFDTTANYVNPFIGYIAPPPKFG